MHESRSYLTHRMSCSWCFVFFLLLQVTGSATWPKGKYALLKPDTGCPDGWKDKGWIFQVTNDINPKNNRSESLHIDGNVRPSYVFRSFCVKTALGEEDWPIGSYCIYRKRERRKQDSLVSGMTPGWIKLDDNKSGGSYKTTVTYINYYEWIYYSLNTRNKFLILYFLCKTDTNTKDPISLPITKPFYLLPYGSRACQQVQWMVATSEWIKYDLTNPTIISASKVKPFFSIIKHSSNDQEIVMYYCYYKSCNYTLTDKEGVFQSPGFPGKYPDGQLCSWRIMVPDHHTLHVRFTNFSLEENDSVTLFKDDNGSHQLNDTFQSSQSQQFTVTATGNAIFVFRTNEEGSNTGFRAEYSVSKASETTTLTPSTKRNNDHTSTVPTTETRNKNNNTADNIHKSRVGECEGADTTVFVVIPLICLIVVIAIVIIIFYQWRLKKMKCEKCESVRYPKEDVMNPTYDEHIQIHQRTSTATMNTTVGTDDNDGQMYQGLSHDQQPEYQVPDYSIKNTNELSMDSGYPEYNELEPMDNSGPGVVYDVLEGPDLNCGPGVVYDVLEGPDLNCGPGVVYDVLEGPDSSDGPSGDQMYQALNKKTTRNPLYQSTTPATMVTRNPLYVDSVA